MPGQAAAGQRPDAVSARLGSLGGRPAGRDDAGPVPGASAARTRAEGDPGAHLPRLPARPVPTTASGRKGRPQPGQLHLASTARSAEREERPGYLGG